MMTSNVDTDVLFQTRLAKARIALKFLPGGYKLPSPAKVLDWLYLGSLGDAQDHEHMSSLGISHVVNLAHMDYQYDCKYAKDSLKIKAPDENGYPILENHLGECASFIKDARSNDEHKVLVHCLAGVNRSATILVAYLILHERMKFLEAIRAAHKVRPFILTNPSFLKQLLQLAEKENLIDDEEEWEKIQLE